MPIKPNREYRAMPVMQKREDALIESDYYVEGYATTFNERYQLWDDGENTYFEIVDRNALEGTDLTDVLFLHNHEGRCLARNKMKAGKEPTLVLSIEDGGLLVGADLGTIAEARSEYDAITSGLIYQMSFAFTVDDDEIEKTGEHEYTRTIKHIKKVYDVSAVDMPANPFTDISARSFEGFIEAEKQEFAKAEERKRKLALIRIKAERLKNGL